MTESTISHKAHYKFIQVLGYISPRFVYPASVTPTEQATTTHSAVLTKCLIYVKVLAHLCLHTSRLFTFVREMQIVNLSPP